MHDCKKRDLKYQKKTFEFQLKFAQWDCDRFEKNYNKNIGYYPTINESDYDASTISVLPNEILSIIISFIPIINLMDVLLTCKKFFIISNSNHLWAARIRENFPTFGFQMTDHKYLKKYINRFQFKRRVFKFHLDKFSKSILEKIPKNPDLIGEVEEKLLSFFDINHHLFRDLYHIIHLCLTSKPDLAAKLGFMPIIEHMTTLPWEKKMKNLDHFRVVMERCRVPFGAFIDYLNPLLPYTDGVDWAARNGDFEIVELLGKQKPPVFPGLNSIYDVIKNGDLRCLEYMISNNCDGTERKDDDSFFRSLMSSACIYGQVGVIRYLYALDKETHVLTDKKLCAAVKSNRVEAVKVVFELNDAIEITEKVVRAICENENPDVIRFFYSHKNEEIRQFSQQILSQFLQTQSFECVKLVMELDETLEITEDNIFTLLDPSASFYFRRKLADYLATEFGITFSKMPEDFTVKLMEGRNTKGLQWIAKNKPELITARENGYFEKRAREKKEKEERRNSQSHHGSSDDDSD